MSQMIKPMISEDNFSIKIVKDNSSIKKEDLSPISSITEKILDKTLEQLQTEKIFIFPDLVKDAEDITKKQMILKSDKESYCTGNVMGFLGCGEEQLEIGSRFYDAKDHDDFFLWYLLTRVLGNPSIVNLKTNANPKERLLDLMIFLFPFYLRKAARKGAFKLYKRVEYNDGHVKGTIDIARHIAKNTPFIGNVAYSQREYTYDNYVMELVRHTIEFIKRKPYGRTLLSKVKDEVRLVVDATPRYEYLDRQRVITENKQNTVRHCYYREYRDLQRLCILILQHQKHQIGFGSHQIYGILFDGAWLWEEYVNSLIGDSFFHPMNKGRKGPQQLFTTDKGKTGLIYPDFISIDSTNRVIADAKYKPIGNIGNSDYLQVLAYMYRFDAKIGFYCYPEAGDEKASKLQLNQGSTYEKNVEPRPDIFVIKLGIKIPSRGEDYKEFEGKMHTAEEAFKADLQKHIKDVSDIEAADAIQQLPS